MRSLKTVESILLLGSGMRNRSYLDCCTRVVSIATDRSRAVLPHDAYHISKPSNLWYQAKDSEICMAMSSYELSVSLVEWGN